MGELSRVTPPTITLHSITRDRHEAVHLPVGRTGCYSEGLPPPAASLRGVSTLDGVLAEQNRSQVTVRVMVAGHESGFPVDQALISRQLLNSKTGVLNCLVVATGPLQEIRGLSLKRGIDLAGKGLPTLALRPFGPTLVGQGAVLLRGPVG